MNQAELDFPFNQLATFVDMETNERLQVDPKLVREQYIREVNDFIETYRRDCTDSGIEYVLASTATPYDQMLRSYLGLRSRMR